MISNSKVVIGGRGTIVGSALTQIGLLIGQYAGERIAGDQAEQVEWCRHVTGKVLLGQIE